MKILIVGDSYTYGQGCSDLDDRTDNRLQASKYCWASLLEQTHTNITVQNFSCPGLDNISIAQRLWTNIELDTNVVLFCGTLYNRFCVNYPDGSDHRIMSINPHFQRLQQKELKDFGSAVDQYYRYLYSDQVGYNTSTCALLSAYACAMLNNAKFFWSIPMKQFREFDGNTNPMLDKLKHLQFTACPEIEYSKDCFAPCMHPNNQGHELYYNRVISELVKNF